MDVTTNPERTETTMETTPCLDWLYDLSLLNVGDVVQVDSILGTSRRVTEIGADYAVAEGVRVGLNGRHVLRVARVLS